jgi:hypothetical protein
MVTPEALVRSAVTHIPKLLYLPGRRRALPETDVLTIQLGPGEQIRSRQRPANSRARATALANRQR